MWITAHKKKSFTIAVIDLTAVEKLKSPQQEIEQKCETESRTTVSDFTTSEFNTFHPSICLLNFIEKDNSLYKIDCNHNLFKSQDISKLVYDLTGQILGDPLENVRPHGMKMDDDEFKFICFNIKVRNQ